MKKLLMSVSTLVFLSFGFTGAASAASYQVKSGDTLWGISKKHKVTVSQIKAWNKLKSDRIHPKQILQIGAAAKPAAKKPAAKKPAPKVKGVSYKEITVKATAYTASCKGCSGITSMGYNLKKNPNLKIISVDPRVIPLGSKVWVEGYGDAIAGDKGSAIRGNKIDVFIPSKQRAINWGVRTVKVKIYK